MVSKWQVRSAVSGKSEAPVTRSWVSWVSWVSWQGARHAQRASRLASNLPPARDAACKWAGRPQGSRLQVGGPPARDAACKWAGRPQGISLDGGGQDIQDHQDTQDVAGPRVEGRGALGSGWQVANAERGPVARKWLAQSTGHWPESCKCGAQRVASAKHRPLSHGCLGCPGCPGKAPVKRSGLRALQANYQVLAMRRQDGGVPSQASRLAG